MLNKTFNVLIDEYKTNSGVSIGRTFKDAPEIDNIVVLEEKIAPGRFVDVRITSTDVYEVRGVLA